ncbi:RRP15-like protein [Hyposmocoma kahamanoa]|uniref:RRP15-like protein n=1 Tax=Hyposmocoma kahamanoa TaxID=1477025 RepID=UPI000E6D904E|nr:RRP15-like protein [Hyposmocoma kahamanoa]
MMVAEEMSKPILKVSVSDSESLSVDESENEENGSGVESNPEDLDADAESDSSMNEDESDNDLLMKNEGWADSVAKILGSSKPKNKKTLVLSRAKKFSEVITKEHNEKPSFEVIGDTTEKKDDNEVKKEDIELPVKKIKLDKPSIRVKPNILEKDRERLLNKIATKGVVQLFNAVRNQQKTLEKDLERSDLSESKKEKILKKFDKRTFLDSLMGQTKSVVIDEVKTMKNEVKGEDKPKWNALRDDFMMGAKMKDWDKESVDE